MPGLSREEIAAYFRAQRAVVYRWALFLCRNREDARELVQDVFVRMLRRPPERGSSVATVVAWLRTTTQRLAMDRWRSAGRRPAAGHLSEAPAAAEAGVDPDEGARLRRALGRLSGRQRLILLARVCDELSFPQIADELGISVSSAKTHYLRGLDALRARLGDDKQRRVS